MLKALNKIFGSIAAFVLYPIKSLFITLAFMLATLIVGIVALVAIPIIFTMMAVENSDTNKFFAGLATWLVSSAVMLLVTPVLIGRALIQQAFNGVADFVKSAVFGVSDGYEHGLFFHVLRRTLFDCAVFNRNVHNIMLSINEVAAHEVAGLDAEILAGLREEDEIADYFDLEDVPVDHPVNNVPVLHEQPGERPQRVFEPLTTEELIKADGIDVLEDTLKHYKDLYDRLAALDADLINKRDGNNQLAKVMDELIVMGITKPVLLVKQYQDEHGKWRAKPGRTNIIDGPSMDEWLSRHNSHPSTREAMDKATPEMINGVERAARYRMKTYKSMADAQELVEASVVIRKELGRADLSNVEIGQVVSGLQSQLGNTFWGATANGQRRSQEVIPPNAHDSTTSFSIP